jgi:hypothetical protein
MPQYIFNLHYRVPTLIDASHRPAIILRTPVNMGHANHTLNVLPERNEEVEHENVSATSLDVTRSRMNKWSIVQDILLFTRCDARTIFT